MFKFCEISIGNAFPSNIPVCGDLSFMRSGNFFMQIFFINLESQLKWLVGECSGWQEDIHSISESCQNQHEQDVQDRSFQNLDP